MDQHPSSDRAQGWRPSTWITAIERRIPPVLIENLRRLGLRRGIPVFVLAWLLLLLAVDAIYPIDVRGWFISALLILFYLLPTWLAFDQGHRRRVTISVLNVLLGWTIIGWFGLLLWSMTRSRRDSQEPLGAETGALGTDA
ncbi:superinfection immunity protein [Allochromatium humboldtianum]|uniref:Superinfection immunity protein n=1 Tax=Allochromatium humboldtianum TaxID=504901 RepID=A0A850RKV0_9GAMM|nr:superinfection immunity protein [Allochromatium humboldtianum]NVZ09613.1 superinfection immunity protein [Allochromatium humboldtianum]